MIDIEDIHRRLFGYFDRVFGDERTLFNFNISPSACYMIDRQTDSPRPAVKTLLEYRVESNEPWGNGVSTDSPTFDLDTKEEKINVRRKLHVVCNVLSKKKGDAKDALNFFIAANQSSRHQDAAYSDDFDFNLPMHRIDLPYRDLSVLENQAWTERVEADLHFNYMDTIEFGVQYSIPAPSTIFDTKDIIQYELETKEGV